jgi:hypothetical protein
MKFPYASVASDETGATAAIFWEYAPEPPRLTLIDVEVSTVAALSAFLPHLNGRLYELAHEMMPAAAQAASPHGRFLNSLYQPPPFVPSIFAPATLGQMLGLLSIAHVEIPELIERMMPEDKDLKAAMFTSAGMVRLSRAAAGKTENHPFNAIVSRQVGQVRSAVAEAYVLGVLAGLYDPGSFNPRRL